MFSQKHANIQTTGPHRSLNETNLIILRENLARVAKLPHNGLASRVRPRLDITREGVGADKEAFAVTRDRVRVGHDGFAVYNGLFKGEGPEELCDAQEHVSLRDMDARTEASAGPVRVVVTLLVVGARCQLGRQRGLALVVVGIENIRVGEAGGIVVHAPRVDHDDGALGDELSIDPVIYGGAVSQCCKRFLSPEMPCLPSAAA